MIESSVSRQNQVLADFFSTVQSDLRGNNTVGEDIHLEHSNGKDSTSAKEDGVVLGGKGGTLASKNSKIEVSDDEDDDEDEVKLVKVLQSDNGSDIDSDSDSELDIGSDTELDSDKDNDYEEDSVKSKELHIIDEKQNDDTRIKLNRNNEIFVNAIEELVEDKSSKLDIKEVFLSNCHDSITSELNCSSGLSSLMIMLNSNRVKENDTLEHSCIVEEVTDTLLHDADSEMSALTNEDSNKSTPSPTSKEPLAVGDATLKKMKITKVSNSTNNNSSTSKENNKKESVVELRNKAVLLGLATREESAKLKKNELLELLKNKE
jgi:hypothetical protein